MYGMDPARRMDELAAAQGSLNPRYGQHPKEKSRDAARSRRGKENYEFYELAKMLPLPGAITSQLDKASIVRLTIAYLRLREFAAHGDPPWNRDGRFDGKPTLKGSLRRLQGSHTGGLAMEVFEEHEGTHILQSLDGFAISLASDGRFLYISETVSIYLGLSQVEMTGSSFFDYIHPNDHHELAEQLGVTLAKPDGSPDSPRGEGEEGAGTSGPAPPIPDVCYPVTSLMINHREDKNGKPCYERAFCIRMKSTLTKRGCHFKSSGYRVVLLLGQLRPQYSYPHTKKCNTPIMGFIGLAIALPPPSVHEVRLETDMFVTRLSFDFKIAHCEAKVADLLDYSADDLTGKSLYALCHGGDVDKIKQTHTDLIKKGQVMSTYIRFLNRRGGYTWMQMCATLVCNTKNENEQSIICVNYVLSGSQYSHVVMDREQVDQPMVRIKHDTDDASVVDQGHTGSPDSCRDGEYSNQGSEGGRHSQTNLNLDPGLDTYNAQGYTDNDPHSLRLGQAPVETSNHGLSEQEVAVSPPAAPPRPNTASPSPHGRASITSSPPSRHDTPDVPDQNSNSVRDLENAMSKHLPKSTSESADMSISGAASNLLLKQFYAGRTGSLEAGQGEQPPFLRGGYTSLGPAQPVPLKPSSLYLDQYPDQSNLYTSHGSTSSFQLYNRGQSWYPGT